MTAKSTHLLVRKVGRTIGSTVGFFISADHAASRWIKRGIAVCLVLPALVYLGREMAGIVVTMVIAMALIIAITQRRTSNGAKGENSEFYEPSSEVDDSQPVDNDPYSQNNIHNPIFHESDFNWNEKD